MAFSSPACTDAFFCICIHGPRSGIFVLENLDRATQVIIFDYYY